MQSRGSVNGPANQNAWPRQNKKPRHAHMSRRNSCPNSFLPPAWWQLSLWALAPSTLAKPKLFMPSRCRHRFMLSLWQPRNTDRLTSGFNPKQSRTFASGVRLRGCPLQRHASGVVSYVESLWPNPIPSTTLRVRGRCRALDSVAPGGTVPVNILDRRCACRKLQSWPFSGPHSFWAPARSTRPNPSQSRPQWSLSRFRPRNTKSFAPTAPARLAPVVFLSPSSSKGAAC